MKKWILAGMLSMVLGLSFGCSAEQEDVSEVEIESSEEEISENKTLLEKVEDSKPLFVDEFTAQDIYGNTVTRDFFEDYDLTLVNLFATWCGPCISEMPELAQLHKDMKDKGVNVVAVVLDACVGDQIDEAAVKTAQELAEVAKADFTFMIPDKTYFNGYLYKVYSVPETLLIDKKGNQIGESYIGARDYDAWMTILEDVLADIQGAEE